MRVKILFETYTYISTTPKRNKLQLKLIEKNQLLKEVRDILLPRLMTGMIDVESLETNEGLEMVAKIDSEYKNI